MSESEKGQRPNPLLEIERVVRAEAREWERRRLEEKLQEEADRVGKVFPLSQSKAQQRRETVIPIRTAAGVVKIIAWYGWDPGKRKWGCPVREYWGLTSRQEMSPGFEDLLAFTVTATGSYQEAALLAEKWGCKVDDWTLQVLTQRLGQKAEEQTQARLKTLPLEMEPLRADSEVAIFMLDGWKGRFRGPGWGKKKTKRKRV